MPCVPHKEGATIPPREVPKMGGALSPGRAGKCSPTRYRTPTGFPLTKEVRHQAEDLLLPQVAGCGTLVKRS